MMSKLNIVVAVVALVAMGTYRLGLGAETFHRGGVGPCSGCHSMHKILDGQL